jgi:hypothetical protein
VKPWANHAANRCTAPKVPGNFERALHPALPPHVGAAMYQKRTKGLYLGNGAVNAM